MLRWSPESAGHPALFPWMLTTIVTPKGTHHAYREDSPFAVLAILFQPFCVTDIRTAADWKPADGPLTTRWAKDVSPTQAWPEYPRPQMVRPEWVNLNGLWDYAITDAAAAKPDIVRRPDPGSLSRSSRP